MWFHILFTWQGEGKRKLIIVPGEEGSKSNKVGTSAVDLLGLIIGRDVS